MPRICIHKNTPKPQSHQMFQALLIHVTTLIGPGMRQSEYDVQNHKKKTQTCTGYSFMMKTTSKRHSVALQESQDCETARLFLLVPQLFPKRRQQHCGFVDFISRSPHLRPCPKHLSNVSGQREKSPVQDSDQQTKTVLTPCDFSIFFQLEMA